MRFESNMKLISRSCICCLGAILWIAGPGCGSGQPQPAVETPVPRSSDNPPLDRRAKAPEEVDTSPPIPGFGSVQKRKKLLSAQFTFQEDGDPPPMKQTPSGLKYRVLEPGTGRLGKPQETFTAAYTLRLENGKIVDSFEYIGGVGDIPEKLFLPIIFHNTITTPGWLEGMSLIREGGIIELEIPPNLAYGAEGGNGAPPNATLYMICKLFALDPLTFQMQAKKIIDEGKFEKSPSGVFFKILKPGNDRKPSFTNRVKIHYRVSRIDGVKYIDTYETGVPAEMAVVRMVTGMSEGVKLIGEGGSIDLVLDPSVGFKRHSQTEGVPDNVLARVQIDLLEILPNKAINLPKRAENLPAANPENATPAQTTPNDGTPKSEATGK